MNRFITELENDAVLLKQTTKEDFDDLYAIGGLPHMWEQHSQTDRYKKDIFFEYLDGGLENDLGCFTIIKKQENKVIGWSRFYTYNKNDPSVRIGYTFIGSDYWGTSINFITKKLMIDFAFEFVEVVYFDIYSKNFRSQRSVMKLGSVLDKEDEKKCVFKLTKEKWNETQNNN